MLLGEDLNVNDDKCPACTSHEGWEPGFVTNDHQVGTVGSIHAGGKNSGRPADSIRAPWGSIFSIDLSGRGLY